MINPTWKYFIDNLPLIIAGSVVAYLQWKNSQKTDLGNRMNKTIISKVDDVHKEVNSRASNLAETKIADDLAAREAALLASTKTNAAVLAATKAHAETIADLTRQLMSLKSVTPQEVIVANPPSNPVNVKNEGNV